MRNITISHRDSRLQADVHLPTSKSETNRLLIMQALSGGSISVENISDSLDTRRLIDALASQEVEVDIGDAGTAMRFLTAYFCVRGMHRIITGSGRMHERPVGVLVDALRELGFNIKYLGTEGFPPLEIIPVDINSIRSEIHMPGNISSQYITALLMIAPVLPRGLTIHFTTPLVSEPYVHLTLDVLMRAGISYIEGYESIHVSHQHFASVTLAASMDWSAASYWYTMAALAERADVTLRGLSLTAPQGDKRIAEWAAQLGADTLSTGVGINLSHSGTVDATAFDFTDQPDLAQTIIVLCAARNISPVFTGMDSLRIKETDRIMALQNELAKFGVKLVEKSKGTFTLEGIFHMSHQRIHTYGDHRMAMAFAPLAMLGTITIEDADVVEKSYPAFWKEMKKAGFEIVDVE